MEKDEFIEELGIDGEQDFTDGSTLVVSLTEKSWAKAQVSLDNCEELEEDTDGSSVSYEQSNLQYLNDYFIINLIADFSADEYRLVIKDR